MEFCRDRAGQLAGGVLSMAFAGALLAALGVDGRAVGFLELVPYGLILLLIVGLMMLEPHMSGTILILAGAAAVLFAAGIKLYWFAGGGAALMGLVVLMMSGYQSTRILVWQDPWAYPRDGGYQIIQSLYAIGSGGLLGLGLGKSRQKFLYQNPVQGMFFPSFRLLRKNTQTREVPTAEGLLPFSRLLFLSFPFGIHVSTDGMDDTDSG